MLSEHSCDYVSMFLCLPTLEPSLCLRKALAPSSGLCVYFPLYFHTHPTTGPSNYLHSSCSSTEPCGWRGAGLQWLLVSEDLGHTKSQLMSVRVKPHHTAAVRKLSIRTHLFIYLFFPLNLGLRVEGGPSLFTYWLSVMRMTAASSQPLVAQWHRKLDECALKINA